jgi:hypothetical protein
MQRHIKKQKKRLKREKMKGSSPNKRVNKYYPAIYCLEEKLFIGVSREAVPPRKAVGYKVNVKDWLPHNCNFRAREYIIDLRKHKEGDVINCPKCNKPVDFRLWMSSTKPLLVEVKNEKNNIDQLPTP